MAGVPRLLTHAHKSQLCCWQHQTSPCLLLASQFFFPLRLCICVHLSSLMPPSRSCRGRASRSNLTQQETARTVSSSGSRSRGCRERGRLPHQHSGGSTSQAASNSHVTADPTEEASSSTGNSAQEDLLLLIRQELQSLLQQHVLSVSTTLPPTGT